MRICKVLVHDVYYTVSLTLWGIHKTTSAWHVLYSISVRHVWCVVKLVYIWLAVDSTHSRYICVVAPSGISFVLSVCIKKKKQQLFMLVHFAIKGWTDSLSSDWVYCGQVGCHFPQQYAELLLFPFWDRFWWNPVSSPVGILSGTWSLVLFLDLKWV